MVERDRFRILLLSDAASFHTQRIAEQYRKQNCEVFLLSMEEGEKQEGLLERRGPIKQFHYYYSVPQIKKVIAEFEPDVINAHFASGYGHIASLANQSFGISLIVNLWGSDILIVPDKSFLHRRKTTYALKSADYIVGDSQYLIDKAKMIYPFTHYEVIPWGIEREYLSLHKKDYSYSKPLKIIVPRHHETVYNNRFIVESLLPLINDNKIELTFPAFGSLFGEFKIFCENETGGKIKFYEKKSRPDFLKLMSVFDIYLSASKSDSSPVSLIESMALGLLPVAADIDGIKEWLTVKNGFVFKQSDKKSLYDVLIKIINSGDTFEGLRKSNFEKVKREAIFEENITEQIDMMKKLASEKKE